MVANVETFGGPEQVSEEYRALALICPYLEYVPGNVALLLQPVDDLQYIGVIAMQIAVYLVHLRPIIGDALTTVCGNHGTHPLLS